MINKIRSIIEIILRHFQNKKDLETILINQGKILSTLNSQKNTTKLSDYEWKIFSQWGEDGIIDFLVSEVSIVNKTFIEFGVENFSESNCRYLLMQSDWNGFVIDSSQKNIEKLKNSDYFWKYDLQTLVAFIDTSNINELLIKSGFERDLGILSIDIDGNDYHILNKIDCFDPRIIICEFNPVFGNDRKITVPYDPKFYRTKEHHSNLYFGASINALRSLLIKQDYTLVGTGMQGNNAYFIKNSLMTDRLRILAKNPFCFNFNLRESRDINGNLNFLRTDLRYKEIKGMNVLNVETGNLEKL
ncbi:hypothetical protein N8841_02050 [Candidatus Pelagibacter sp.]|nr:hypothetical protein [Candidatus Pelagibacter sp.]